MDVRHFVSWAGTVAEVAGVVSMLLGAVIAISLAVVTLRRHSPHQAFVNLRQNLGRAILLGLEFLVAADIIRTVSDTPTLRSVTVLGLIVLIRTFLSFTLEVELDGHWPWRREPLNKPDSTPERHHKPA